MDKYIVSIVELIIRCVYMLISMYITIYVIVSYEYTLIQFVTKYIHTNGVFIYDDGIGIIYIILYCTILINLPIIIFHVVIYIMSSMYMSDIIKYIYNSCIILIYLFIVHWFAFNYIVPVILIIYVDHRYNIGSLIVMEPLSYIILLGKVLLLCIAYVCMLFVVLYKIDYIAISIYRRRYMFIIVVILVFSDSMYIEGILFVIVPLIIITEVVVICRIMALRITGM
jgi:hypothetical protein